MKNAPVEQRHRDLVFDNTGGFEGLLVKLAQAVANLENEVKVPLQARIDELEKEVSKEGVAVRFKLDEELQQIDDAVVAAGFQPGTKADSVIRILKNRVDTLEREKGRADYLDRN
jgi:hypothetical protein